MWHMAALALCIISQMTVLVNNTENPGTTFNTIQEELTSKIGEAPIVEESELHGKVWKWDLRNKTEVDLFYINDGVVLVMYIYKES